MKTSAKNKNDPLVAKSRDYPKPPMPSKHLKKPGLESELDLKPMFEAPHYKGSGKLEGLAALITGGDSGIGRAVAVLFAREGADILVCYLNEDIDARHTQELVKKEGRRCSILKGDVGKSDFCRKAVTHCIKEFGRLDVLVSNAAFQQHVAKLEELSDEQFDLTLLFLHGQGRGPAHETGKFHHHDRLNHGN